MPALQHQNDALLYDAVPDDIDDLLSTDADHVGTYFPQADAWFEQRGYNTTITTAYPELFPGPQRTKQTTIPNPSFDPTIPV